MKKDKETHQPVTEVLVPKVSSVTLTLQLLNKEKEKHKEAENKESAEDAAKVRCKTCFKEIAPKRLCSGHGSGGGGGASETSDNASDEKANPAEDKSLTKSGKVVEKTDEIFAAFDSESLILDSHFDPEIIADLLAKGLLLVDNDRESLTLTIKLLCEPDVLTKEQGDELQKFMEAILTEFNAFKEENDLSGDCLEIIQDEKSNIISLRITMPTLALYDAFIQRLANNLVPIPGLKSQEKDEITKAQSAAHNPLSREHKLSNQDHSSKREEIEPQQDMEVEMADEEKQEIFNPSPFNMKPW
ncbi:hypothetical protein Lgee_0167 [Legionella geestiana]|uniref:Uncharacterized protein n=1 Tax=Legionella geestiana TaxID=45065 RepID=A0A0W0U8W0_9GAMM|nr:hypothetical protein [Legionella geestiana]KTD04414.1 hypothetical protein Lgee_0167 [Legionella geestiana]QBS12936.1 hypothetical protein E4T54_09385 [Legionella geestiana]QDQ39384.1 hypothetical protein E3226_002685 [Legionella geestiana]STX54566.1 Uncharacterised protein [Legionella geestiana]